MLLTGKGRAIIAIDRPAFLLLLIISIPLLLYHNPKAPLIEVSLPAEGQVLYSSVVKPGDRFTYSFIHSVEQCLVVEIFQIGPDHKIYLVETHFGGLGAGLPYNSGGHVVVEDGLIKITGLNRLVAPMNLKTSSFTSSRLEFLDASLDLSAPGVAGKVIEIKTTKNRGVWG